MSATWYLPPTDLILTLLHSQQKIYGRNANVKAQTLRVRKWLSRHSASQAHANWKVRPWHLVFIKPFLRLNCQFLFLVLAWLWTCSVLIALLQFFPLHLLQNPYGLKQSCPMPCERFCSFLKLKVSLFFSR